MSNATELLSRALKFLDYRKIGSDTLEKDIKTFLAAEPEAEPVAWGQPDACGNIVETITPDDKTHTKAPKGWADIYSVPLYTRPEPEENDPVAWIQPNHLDKAQFMPFLCRVEPKQRDDFIPLYTRPEPAIREPMTEEEIDEELETNEYYCAKSFADGVRFAEKHHGIGGDDD